MISGAKLKDSDGSNLSDYKLFLAKIMCLPPTPDCHLDECKNCPGTDQLKEQLMNKLEEEMIESVAYRQWVSVDRCNFEIFVKSTEDFVDSFCEQLQTLKKTLFYS